jgi:3-hydroxyisobutyrate dehydrogenase
MFAIEMASQGREVIAFIGLGQMGQPMARRLIEAGYVVRSYDRSAQAQETFRATGNETANSARDACANASVVITMLPNGDVVRDALLEGSAITAAVADALVIDMSSSAPFQTRELGYKLKSFGFSLIDAPVSGGVRRAIDGSLAIMVGGEASCIERARPILEVLGRTIRTVGPLGAGHAMKALNNYVSAAGLVAACEAVIVGRSFGLDPETIVDVLNASTGRNNSTEAKMKPFVLSESFASGFSMALMAKDIKTAADLSLSLNADAEGILTAAELWNRASESLGPGTDHTAIFQFLAARLASPKRLPDVKS